MNKVVCNLCGTSYPENAAQCPICGYARTADASSANSGNGTYTYVKGGRFSKANVKKRNQAAGVASSATAVSEKKSKKSGNKSGAGLLVAVIVLLLAIIAVLGYIAVRFFLPGDSLFGNSDPISSEQVQEQTPVVTDDNVEPEPSEELADTQPDLSCKSVALNQTQIEFFAVGAEVKLVATADPVDTTDQMTFSSSDTAVITVSDDGTVTAVAEGSAVITVTCGSASAECTVTCVVPTEAATISLNRKEITFTVEGQSWVLYDGDVPVDDIVWSSDDNNVATIESGKVYAVANGDTTVYGVYNGQTVSCVIHCKLDEESSGDAGGISEADGETGGTYKMYNPTGYADDVTLKVGEKFTLRLVDEFLNIITDAQWTIEDEDVCSYEDSIVKALKVGQTKIIATYEGVTCQCVVRVIEE